MSAVGKIINGIFVPFGEENTQQFTGTPEEIKQNIESGQLHNGAMVFDNGTNKNIGRIENGEYVPYTGGDTTVDFTEAEERANIDSSNPLKIIFGKVKKWFTDFGEAAFANIANNRVTNEPGFVMDARQGKEIQDQIDTINSALDNIGSGNGNLPVGAYVYVLKTSSISFVDAYGYESNMINALDILRNNSTNYDTGFNKIFSINQNFFVMLNKLDNDFYSGILTSASEPNAFFFSHNNKGLCSLLIPQKV